MPRLVNIKCKHCEKHFDFEEKYYKYRLKQNPETNFFCSKECRTSGAFKQVEANCEKCGKAFFKRLCDVKKTNRHFCSRSCFVSLNNKTKKVTDDGKELNCVGCGVLIKVSKFCSPVKVRCKSCVPAKKPRKPKKPSKYRRPRQYSIRSKKAYICKVCNCEFTHPWHRATCGDKCRHIDAVNSGLKSAKAQSEKRRSKNEMHFASLCKENFSVVLENEPIFKDKNGNHWDADVVLPEQKIAILWNGIWHYQKVRQKHSIKQVKSRDKIKESVIVDNGYTPYIIKDMGKEDIEFVKNEFSKFLVFLENHLK